MQEWIEASKQLPAQGQSIVCLRNKYPMFYWVGEYTLSPEEAEDKFTHWFPVPPLPDFEAPHG